MSDMISSLSASSALTCPQPCYSCTLSYLISNETNITKLCIWEAFRMPSEVREQESENHCSDPSLVNHSFVPSHCEPLFWSFSCEPVLCCPIVNHCSGPPHCKPLLWPISLWSTAMAHLIVNHCSGPSHWEPLLWSISLWTTALVHLNGDGILSTKYQGMLRHSLGRSGYKRFSRGIVN